MVLILLPLLNQKQVLVKEVLVVHAQRAYAVAHSDSAELAPTTVAVTEPLRQVVLSRLLPLLPRAMPRQLQ